MKELDKAIQNYLLITLQFMIEYEIPLEDCMDLCLSLIVSMGSSKAVNFEVLETMVLEKLSSSYHTYEKVLRLSKNA